MTPPPVTGLEELVPHVGPVLVFLLAITVVAQLADAAGVFAVAASAAARAARGRVWAVWLLTAGLATLSTVVLSLDTTAVLLTPVVLALATTLDLPPAPFALTTVWLANTASLLLPVSNLTNLLALHHLDGAGAYLRVSWAPALALVSVTVLAAAVRFRRALTGRYQAPPPPEVADRVLLRVAAAVCLLLGPAFVSGVTAAWPACAAAAVLVTAFAVRRPEALRAVRLPWALVLGVLFLFVLVELAHQHGLTDLLMRLTGTGTNFADLLRLAVTAALGANAVDNLPAYLALEPLATSSPERLLALLIGVNAGAILTPWGSLATLLWIQRCRDAGVAPPVRSFVLTGLVLVPLLLLTATAALAAAT